MARRRDPFANFERMRREMDEIFGPVWQRPALASRRGRGFSPRVDVYYCGEPPRAIVKVDLAGVDLGAIALEVSGRELVISGERPLQETEGRVYQQVDSTSDTVGSPVIAKASAAMAARPTMASVAATTTPPAMDR